MHFNAVNLKFIITTKNGINGDQPFAEYHNKQLITQFDRYSTSPAVASSYLAPSMMSTFLSKLVHEKKKIITSINE